MPCLQISTTAGAAASHAAANVATNVAAVTLVAAGSLRAFEELPARYFTNVLAPAGCCEWPWPWTCKGGLRSTGRAGVRRRRAIGVQAGRRSNRGVIKQLTNFKDFHALRVAREAVAAAMAASAYIGSMPRIEVLWAIDCPTKSRGSSNATA